MQIRLDKYLADQGFGTRSQVKDLIRKKAVTVDGIPAAKPELKLDPNKSQVKVRGTLCSDYEKYAYYMLNKPAGVVSATEDKHEKTVLDLLKEVPARGLFPVGRLDKDTEGLLILTNHGSLAHELLAPKKHVEKCYYVCLDHPISTEDPVRFEQGLEIGQGERSKPAKLECIAGKEKDQVLCTITEGKFHQVKRMFHAVGKEVVYLKRLSMGPLQLDENLKPGEYRKLNEAEVIALMEHTR